MRWLVTGSNGMLGADLVALLRSLGESVTAADRQTLDVTHRKAAGLLRLNAPEVEAATRLMAAEIGPTGKGGVTLKRHSGRHLGV